jgi:hypothetical protein
MIFEDKYFRKMKFSLEQVEKYITSADKDIKIASTTNDPDIKFQFAYNALIKLGIAAIASRDYKVSSRAGHHIKIIEKASEILKYKDVLIYGNQMRKTRNTELYDGGVLITKKQADEYAQFIKVLRNRIGIVLKKKENRLL